MQWLIDVIKDWINTQGFLTSAFVDRGDPAAPDFTDVNFIQDDAWHEIDLSAIVPDNAKAVILTAVTLSDTATSSFTLRKNGNVNDTSVSRILTPLANTAFVADLTCPISTNRKLDYNAQNVTWHVLTLTVKGWIL